MPEKQSNNKIMAMLERRGIIRKSDDELPVTTSSDPLPSHETDIRALFDTPAGDTPKVTPAARQPVPGMITPVFPSEKPTPVSIPREHTVSGDIFEPEKELPSEVSVPEPQRFIEPPKPEPTEAAEPQRQETPKPADTPKPVPVFGSLNPFRSAAVEEKPPALPVESGATERAPQPENYTDRYLNTEELYDALALRSKKTDTVYLIEDYLQTLPDSLPDSARREIVSKIITASGFDYDLLMGDGVLRVKMLKEYAERFARHTDDYIAARQAELDELDQQILRTRRLIENRKELHKKQFYSIEAEAQRLKEILTFISG